MNRLRASILSLSAGLDRLAVMAALTALAVLVLAVLLQVVARYAFASPPSWTEELARYAMIWAGLLGATISFKRRFDPALISSSPGNGFIAKAAGFIQSAVVLIYLLPILWYCFVGPNMNLNRGFLLRHSRTTADAMDFSTVYVAIAVPIMIILVLIHLIARWVNGKARDGQDTKYEG